MDISTWQQHQSLCVAEPQDKRFDGQLSWLNEDEQALFQAIKSEPLGAASRLEQERIAFSWVKKACGI